MKALELKVYPEGGCETAAHCALKQYCVECIEEIDKRFTDAELASEFWAVAAEARQLMGNARRGGKSHAAHVANILYRFATLPHYDEPQS